LWLLILAIVIPFAVIASVLWFIWVAKPAQDEQAFIHETVLRTSGLSRPTMNKLDARFTDANEDLVADPPTDPKDFVDPPKLLFTYVPIAPDDENPDQYKIAFADFVAHLSKVTGKPAEYRLYSSLNDQLKAMRDGELHVCGFNTGAVPEAVDLAGFVPIFKLASADGSASYRMMIIVPADSPLKTISDLRGRDQELTVTDPGSNSGYKAPLVLLRDREGMEPERDYILRYSGGHDKSIVGIAQKKFRAAAVAGDVLKRAVNKGEIDPTQYRVISQSEAFPTACFGYAYNLKPELAAKVREAFATFDWKGTAMEKEFASSEQVKFVPVNFKDDWALIRKIDDAIGTAYKID
jgi:phosphonate transport system substrate-binding protein